MLGKLVKMEERIVLDAAAAPDAAQAQAQSPAADAADSTAEQGTADATEAQNSDGAESTSATNDSGTEGSDTQSATDSSGSATIAGEETSSAAASEYTSLLLVSNDVNNYQALVNSAADSVAVLVYDADNDSLSDILAKIQDNFAGETFDSIAIAAHGSANGVIELTDLVDVNATSLSTEAGQQEFFAALGNLLDADGRLDVLSCFAAAGDAGSDLIAQLEAVTGHNVAGSDDLTGNTTGDGDWVLESDGIEVSSLYFTDTAAYGDSVLSSASNLVVNATEEGSIEDSEISLREAISYASANGGTVSFSESLAGETIWIDSDLSLNGSFTIENTTSGNITVCYSGDESCLFSLSSGSKLLVVTTTADETSDNGATSLREALNAAADGDVIAFASELSSTTFVLGDTDGDGNADSAVSTIAIDSAVTFLNNSATAITVANSSGGALLTFGANDSSKVWIVNTTADETDVSTTLSLREALDSATGASDGDIITFASTVFGTDPATISLNNVLNINCSLNLLGNGNVTLDGGLDWIDSDSDGTSDSYTGTQILNLCGSEGTIAITISGLSFEHGYACETGGGAIYATNAALLLTGCAFRNNLSENSVGGGAVCIEDSSSYLTANNCTFQANRATGSSGDGPSAGGAIYVGTDLNLQDCEFINNDASGAGGAVFLTNAAATIDACAFTQNTAETGDGGALCVDAGSIVEVSGSSFQNNSSGGQGGAIALEEVASASLSSSLISGNDAEGNGGGIYVDGSASMLTITSGIIRNNTATGDGGGVWFSGSSLYVNANSDGQALDSLSLISGNDAEGSGGGIYVDATSACALHINGAYLTGNDAGGKGGGLYLQNNLCAELQLSDLLVFYNTAAEAGGGLYVQNVQSLTISASSITGNVVTGADGFGAGAAFVRENSCSQIAQMTVRMNDSVVQYNQLTDAESAEGAGLYFSIIGGWLNNCVISHNSGGSAGGGIYGYSWDLRMANSIVAGNSSAQGGGIYYEGGSLYAIYSTITGNQASETNSAGGIQAVGLCNEYDLSLLLLNSIVAGNTGYLGDSVTATAADMNYVASYEVEGSTFDCMTLRSSWIGKDISDVLTTGTDANGNVVTGSASTNKLIYTTSAQLGELYTLAVQVTSAAPAAGLASTLYYKSSDGNAYLDTNEEAATLIWLGADETFYQVLTGEAATVELEGGTTVTLTSANIADFSGYLKMGTDALGVARTSNTAGAVQTLCVPATDTTTTTPTHIPDNNAGDHAPSGQNGGGEGANGGGNGFGGMTLGDIANNLVNLMLNQGSSGDGAGLGQTSGPDAGGENPDGGAGQNGGEGNQPGNAGDAAGGNAGGEGGTVVLGGLSVSAPQMPQTAAIFSRSGNITPQMVVDTLLSTSLLSYAGRLSGTLGESMQEASSQSILLSTLTLNAGRLLSVCDALIGQVQAQAEGQAQEVAFAASGSGATGASGAGAIADMVRECQQALLKARGVALQANDMLQLIARNMSDFSDRIAENSFNAGLKKVTVANEQMTIEYEVLNGLLRHIQQLKAQGQTPDPADLGQYIAGLRQDALAKAKLIIGGADRASEDVLAQLVNRMQQSSDTDRDSLRDRVTQMLGNWHAQIGLSAPVQADAVPAGAAHAAADLGQPALAMR